MRTKSDDRTDRTVVGHASVRAPGVVAHRLLPVQGTPVGGCRRHIERCVDVDLRLSSELQQSSNVVYAADITYIPKRRAQVYVAAINDWHRGRVLVWRLSNTMDVGFCVEALQDSFTRFGKPDIFNTDQGLQFTSTEFLQVLRGRNIEIHMHGQACWRDNEVIERLWHSLAYECALRHAFK